MCPREKNNIPMEVVLEDGTTACALDDVMPTWCSKFQDLLNLSPPPESDDQKQFTEFIKLELERKVRGMRPMSTH